MHELLCNNSLFVGQLYEDKLLALRARDLIFFTRPNKNISVVRVTCQKKLGRVGREIFFFQEFFFILKNVYQFPQVTIFSPVMH